MRLRYKRTQLVECRSLVSPISAQLVVVMAAMLSTLQIPKTKAPVYSHVALTLSNDIYWTPAWPEKNQSPSLLSEWLREDILAAQKSPPRSSEHLLLDPTLARTSPDPYSCMCKVYPARLRPTTWTSTPKPSWPSLATAPQHDKQNWGITTYYSRGL